MAYYGKLLHDAMGRGWFGRIDGGYSKEAMEKMYREIDLWVCHTAPSISKMAYFRERGVESWFYGPMIYEQESNSGCGSNTFLDLDLNINRAIGWLDGNIVQVGWNGSLTGTLMRRGTRRRISRSRNGSTMVRVN
jgi:hypothetical protein